LTVNNLVMGSALHTFQLKASANITQKAIILPNNFVTAISGILFKLNGSNITATGNFNFGNNSVGVESETSGAPVNYLDMGSYSLTAGTLYLGLATNNGYIKLGSSASNSISGILISGTGASHILDLGTGTTTVSDNIDLPALMSRRGRQMLRLAVPARKSSLPARRHLII